MHHAEPVVFLLVLVAGLVVLANKLRVPYPVLLVLGGLALSFIPVLPGFGSIRTSSSFSSSRRCHHRAAGFAKNLRRSGRGAPGRRLAIFLSSGRPIVINNLR